MFAISKTPPRIPSSHIRPHKLHAALTPVNIRPSTLIPQSQRLQTTPRLHCQHSSPHTFRKLPLYHTPIISFHWHHLIPPPPHNQPKFPVFPYSLHPYGPYLISGPLSRELAASCLRGGSGQHHEVQVR